MEFNLYHWQRIKAKVRRVLREPDYAFRQLKSRLIYKRFNYLLKGYSFDLNNAFLFLTFSCDLNCKFCSFWGKSGIRKNNFNLGKEELTLGEWKTIIDNLLYYKPNIVLTGGEPLLYKEWFNLAKYIKGKRLNIDLQTNGTHLEENKEEIINSVDNLSVSLDAPTFEINNQIRGKGAFEKTIKGLKAIDKIKKLKGKRRPLINICYTISDLNYQYLKKMISFLLDLEIDVNNLTFQHLMFTNKENIVSYERDFSSLPGMIRGIWSGFDYNPQELDLDYLIDEIKEIKDNEYNRLKVTFSPDFELEEVREFYQSFTKTPLRFSKGCLSPWLEAIIYPDGELLLCPDYTVGNLREERFSLLWNNDYSLSLRKRLAQNGISSVCRSCCGLYVY